MTICGGAAHGGGPALLFGAAPPSRIPGQNEIPQKAAPPGLGPAAPFSVLLVCYASLTDFTNPLMMSSTQPSNRQTQAATET